MKIKTFIKDIKDPEKKPYSNWNHYNFERYNNCPWCDGKITMRGSVSEFQHFECHTCKRTFILNALTESLEYEGDPNASGERFFRIDFEIDNGATFIEDVAFIKARSILGAQLYLKNYIGNLPGDMTISKIFFTGVEEAHVSTGKFGSKYESKGEK